MGSLLHFFLTYCDATAYVTMKIEFKVSSLGVIPSFASLLNSLISSLTY